MALSFGARWRQCAFVDGAGAGVGEGLTGVGETGVGDGAGVGPAVGAVTGITSTPVTLPLIAAFCFLSNVGGHKNGPNFEGRRVSRARHERLEVPGGDVLARTARWAMVQGDALAVLATLPSASVDAIVTDPPYSSGGFTRGDRMRAPSKKYVQTGTKLARPDFGGDSRDQRSFRYWCALWMAECLRVAKPSSPICVFSDWRQLPSTSDAVQAAGWLWRGIVVWDKTGAVRPSMGRFAAQCEYVLWGSAGAMPGRPEIVVLGGLIRERVDPSEKRHITGKPVPVMQALSQVCARDGVILDPFAGSGTTGVGALLEGRRFLGVELSHEYCAIARDRLLATGTGTIAAVNEVQVPLFSEVRRG